MSYGWENWEIVKRPVGIQIAYLDESGDLKEENFFEFKAWMVCHELDHLDGINMFGSRLS